MDGAVTAPLHRHTARRSTLKLSIGALGGAVLLVRAILAVRLPITDPAFQDAGQPTLDLPFLTEAWRFAALDGRAVLEGEEGRK